MNDKRATVGGDSPADDPMLEQAINWYIKLHSSQPARGIERELNDWLAADARHARAFDAVMATSRTLDAVSASPEMVVLRRDALEAARRAARARWKDSFAARLWTVRSGLAAAAVLAAAVSIGWFTLGVDETQRHRTSAGQRLEIKLDDGSKVWLDEATELTVDFNAHRRMLKLMQGQARFEVAHERSRPFEVTAADRSIVAVGTVFNVDMLQSNLYITLMEGRVLVSPIAGGGRATAGPETFELRRAQQLIVEPGKAPRVRANVNVTEAMAWESGRISFEDELLEAAVARVNRYAQRKIVIADPRLNQMRASGIFNAGDSSAFVDAISTWLPIAVSFEDTDKIVLRMADASVLPAA